ncbi:MAG: nucleotidyltransferase family protein [Alphaproteobacteria bacterium CG_4_9_14_3_um_filter_47_13]|nr:MAG: nucleotidyltransferase family protein [Alphaproteobacteria bacterium CG_4_9_14_3_um_filter_47_13]
MKNFKLDHAFILAAGKGTRLRPHTDFLPKPLVEVGGRSLIDRSLDRLIAAGVTNVTVNLHYMADILKAHLVKRTAPEITFSYEPELLDTGGGVKKALSTLGDQPFYVIAGDALWTDGLSGDSLLRLATHWNDKTMDILTYMQPLSSMILTAGSGDYNLAGDGKAVRSFDKTGTHMWTNIRINHPRIFEEMSEGAFSFLPLMDKAEKDGRLYALEHDGAWHHISTPADLARVNDMYTREKKQA